MIDLSLLMLDHWDGDCLSTVGGGGDDGGRSWAGSNDGRWNGCGDGSRGRCHSRGWGQSRWSLNWSRCRHRPGRRRHHAWLHWIAGWITHRWLSWVAHWLLGIALRVALLRIALWITRLRVALGWITLWHRHSRLHRVSRWIAHITLRRVTLRHRITRRIPHRLGHRALRRRHRRLRVRSGLVRRCLLGVHEGIKGVLFATIAKSPPSKQAWNHIFSTLGSRSGILFPVYPIVNKGSGDYWRSLHSGVTSHS